MITKRFILAAAMMMLVAMSGQAYAGMTISDTRYWPGELSSTHENAVQRPENASASVESPRGIGATEHRYQGGPKGDY